MGDNKIHNWCCFSDVEHKFPDMWTDEKQASKANRYCEKQYYKIERAIPIVLEHYRNGIFPKELKEALSIALDCMTETEGIYQDYGREIKKK